MKVTAEELMRMMSIRQLTKLVFSGRVTLNECRAALDLPPVDFGETYYQRPSFGNYIPMTMEPGPDWPPPPMPKKK